MARTFGSKFLCQLERSTEPRLGTELARLAVQAKIPATRIADVLDVSKTSVYSWFRGQGIQEDRRQRVEDLIKLLKQDLANGVLPVSNTDDARRYVKDITSA